MFQRVASVLFILSINFALTLKAQNIEGIWRTVDDATGESKSNILIYKENNKYNGKIVALLRKNAAPDSKCFKCKGDFANKPILNLVNLRGLEVSGSSWKNGKILDPENGNDYVCSAWFEPRKPDELKVRGYLSIFFRTQTWYRVK